MSDEIDKLTHRIIARAQERKRATPLTSSARVWRVEYVDKAQLRENNNSSCAPSVPGVKVGIKRIGRSAAADLGLRVSCRLSKTAVAA